MIQTIGHLRNMHRIKIIINNNDNDNDNDNNNVVKRKGKMHKI